MRAGGGERQSRVGSVEGPVSYCDCTQKGRNWPTDGNR